MIEKYMEPTKTQEIDDWELMRYWEEHAY